MSCIKSTDQLWFRASGVASVRDCVPAVVVCPYGENSSSADSKYGAAFCDSTSILAVAESGKASESRIVGIAQPQPAGRQ